MYVITNIALSYFNFYVVQYILQWRCVHQNSIAHALRNVCLSGQPSIILVWTSVIHFFLDRLEHLSRRKHTILIAFPRFCLNLRKKWQFEKSRNEDFEVGFLKTPFPLTEGTFSLEPLDFLKPFFFFASCFLVLVTHSEPKEICCQNNLFFYSRFVLSKIITIWACAT